MLFKKRKIIQKHIVVCDIPEDYRMTRLEEKLLYMKYVFSRQIEDCFSCIGCILSGKCAGISIQGKDYILKFCRHQDKFLGHKHKIFYRCYEKETL